jgi:hypothetical protein
MDLGRRAERQLYREGPVKVNYDGCHSTEKQKQASHTEVLSSLDAGTDCAGWWSLYTYGLRHLICPRRTPVHSGHMSTTAMLKVNFAQTWGGGGVGACLEKISMGSKDIAQRASIRVSCKASRSERVRPPGSHDRNSSPRPFETASPLTARSCPSLSPQNRVHMGLASLCISNRTHLISRTWRCVYGSGGLAIRSSPVPSSSTFANSSWRRHASPLLLQRLRPFPIAASRGHPNARTLSWAAKFSLRRPAAPPNDADANEEAAKEAVLEAIKGRQQTDLMLRCESTVHRDLAVSQTGSNSFPYRHRS